MTTSRSRPSLVSSERLHRPSWVWVGIILQILVGLMAVPVGLVMIVDPMGNPVGIPHEWIANSPFHSYLVPGIVLLLVNGVGQLSAASLAIVRHPLAPWLMGGLGLGLVIWIAVQVLMIPLSFLQPLLLAVGIVQGLLALQWLRAERRLR